MTYEREGNKDCEHEWVYSNWVVATYPATSHKICKKCGRVEHEQAKLQPKKDTFEEIYKKFEK